MGKELPALRSAELLADTEYTILIDVAQIQHGDIVFLATEEEQDPKRFHVGLVSLIDEEFHVVHNARHIGYAVTQKFDEARQHPQHKRVVAAKRPVVESSHGQNLDFLVTYGFEHLSQQVT